MILRNHNCKGTGTAKRHLDPSKELVSSRLRQTAGEAKIAPHRATSLLEQRAIDAWNNGGELCSLFFLLVI